MDPLLYQKAKAIFGDALELPELEVAAFLDEACGDDLTLRAEVESLLGADDDRVSFLEQVAVDLVRPIQEVTEVGPYRVVRELGRGGMGTVYLAEQTEPVHRLVAVKVLNRGMDTEQIVARFRNEQQILANLDHANIARLINGGETQDGRPWFAMEYVSGLPITQWCEIKRLNTRARLELFAKVCAAVSFAHRNLIIHRDIKPGNILVTEEGEPKLLDFGIARLLDRDQGFTATGHFPMTPAYASPEQIRGEVVTTLGDVYSLGVLLYELLTGHRPFHTQERGVEEVLKQLKGRRPPKPSSVITREVTTSNEGRTTTLTPEQISATRDGSPLRLRRALSGDVDNIVMCALRLEPGSRYASVERMAQDINNHLNGYTIKARKETLFYVTSRFVKRNRLAAAAAVVGILVAVAFMTLVVVQRYRADRERLKAELISRFMVDLFASADPYREEGGTQTVSDLLNEASESIQDVLGNQPAIRAELMVTMGRVLRNQGIYSKALPLVESAVAHMAHDHKTDASALADSLHLLGELHYRQGHIYKAVSPLQRAAAYRDEAGPHARLALAGDLEMLGEVLSQCADYPGAQAALKKALDLRTEIQGSTHPDLERPLVHLALLLRRTHQTKEIDPLFEPYVRRPSGASGEPAYKYYFRNLIKWKQKEYGSHHPSMANTLHFYGRLLAMEGENEALELLFWAYDIRKARLGPQHPLVAETARYLGVYLNPIEGPEESLRLLKEAYAIETASAETNQPFHAETLRFLASKYREIGNYDLAEEVLLKSLDVLEQSYGASHPRLGWGYSNLADIYYDQGKLDKAELLYGCGLASKNEPLPDPELAFRLERLKLADIYARRGEFERAEVLLLNEVARLERKEGITWTPGHSIIFRHYLLAGQQAKAEKHFRQIQSRLRNEETSQELLKDFEKQIAQIRRSIAEGEP